MSGRSPRARSEELSICVCVRADNRAEFFLNFIGASLPSLAMASSALSWDDADVLVPPAAPSTSDEPVLFLCFRRLDTKERLVRPLCHVLDALGVSCFFDEVNAFVGASHAVVRRASPPVYFVSGSETYGQTKPSLLRSLAACTAAASASCSSASSSWTPDGAKPS